MYKATLNHTAGCQIHPSAYECALHRPLSTSMTAITIYEKEKNE